MGVVLKVPKTRQLFIEAKHRFTMSSSEKGMYNLNLKRLKWNKKGSFSL